MPESEQYNTRTVLQNFRLIATWRAVMVFVVAPLIFWPVFCYNILPPHGNRLAPTHVVILWLMMAAALVGVLMVESNKIKTRLEREGYVEWRHPEQHWRQWIDFGIDFALPMATWVYCYPEQSSPETRAQRKPRLGEYLRFSDHVALTLVFLGFTLCVVMRGWTCLL